MGLTEWLISFRQLHAKARAGKLERDEVNRYRAAREELARAVLASQRLTARAGQTARRSLRVARALQVDLEVDGNPVRAMTLDVSSGGFAVLMGSRPRAGEEYEVSLRIGSGVAVRGRARVVEVKPGDGTARVGFEFTELGDDDRERLELLVFDLVLEGLGDAGHR